MNEHKEKFTPGPWIVLHDTNVVSPCNGYIARAYDSPLGPIANRYNATLIAASPDMYEMLDQFRRYIAEGPLGTRGEMYKRIDALLAKARGEADK